MFWVRPAGIVERLLAQAPRANDAAEVGSASANHVDFQRVIVRSEINEVVNDG